MLVFFMLTNCQTRYTR